MTDSERFHATASGPATRPNMTAVGTMVWLGSEIMFFAGLFAMYFTVRSVSPDLWADRPDYLDVRLATTITIILVLSSLWCQFGVWAAEKGVPHRTGKLLEFSKWGMREWFVLTYLFGAVFIGGQTWEFAVLVSEGITPQADPYGSVFFITTGFHGLHVIGGLIAFLLIIARSFTAKRYTHAQASGAVVVSYYWHFVDIVWVALFVVIYLIR